MVFINEYRMYQKTFFDIIPDYSDIKLLEC
jgi:hypothetical protein